MIANRVNNFQAAPKQVKAQLTWQVHFAAAWTANVQFLWNSTDQYI